MSERYLQLGDETVLVAVDHGGDGEARVTLDEGETRAVTVPGAGRGSFVLGWGGARHRVAVARTARGIEVAVDGERFAVSRAAGPAARDSDGGGAGGPIRAPMPGKVVELSVGVGHRVARGDTLGALEAMKLRTALVAPCDGTVSAVGCAVGDQVTGGQMLVEIGPEEA